MKSGMDFGGLIREEGGVISKFGVEVSIKKKKIGK